MPMGSPASPGRPGKSRVNFQQQPGSPSSPPRAGRRMSTHSLASDHGSTGTPLMSAGSPARRRASMAPPNFFDGDDVGETSSNVKVFLRVRPFNKRELKIHDELGEGFLQSVVDMPEGPLGPAVLLEKTVDEDGDTRFIDREMFTFDRILWSIPEDQQPLKGEFCTQEKVFQYVGEPALENAWKGFNTCIFAYGQTGAGKTHSMMGHFTSQDGELHGDPGVIPQVCRALYNEIEKKRAQQLAEEEELGAKKPGQSKLSFETELCAYEIYNERVRDLFYMNVPGRQQKDELRVRKHPLEGPFVENIAKLTPSTWVECVERIEEGNASRTVGATAMNAESSRSHSVFQIRFTIIETLLPQERFEKPIVNRKYSNLNLIDLAGSERNKKSQAEGERLVEATNINLSLTTLKRVIDTLVFNSQHPRNCHKQVPYRDSVLTMLLMHSLGGNSKTMMVAAVSPHHDNAEETLNTLRYASAARKIVNTVRTNEDSKAKQALAMKEQVLKLQEQLAQAQAGEGVADPKELDDMKEQIKLGQDLIRKNAEEAQRVQQELQQAQEEKELEKERRYHAAFQHSFQMVVLRKQKEAARRAAEESERFKQEAETVPELRREGSRLRHQVGDLLRQQRTAEEKERDLEEKIQKSREQVEKSKKEQDDLRWRAYSSRWRDLSKAQQSLRDVRAQKEQELGEIVAAAKLQYDELVTVYSDREGELKAQLELLRQENNQLRKFNSQHTQQLTSLEEKTNEWKQQSLRKDEIWKKTVADGERRSREQMAALRERTDRRVQELEQEVTRITAREKQWQQNAREAAHKREQEIEKLHELKLKNVRAECERVLEKHRDLKDRELSQARDTHMEGMQSWRQSHTEETSQLVERLQQRLLRAEERVEQQRRLLAEVSRRESSYRDLSRELLSLLRFANSTAGKPLTEGDTEGAAALRDFVQKAQTFNAELTSHPIHRDSLRLLQRPLDSAEPTDSPCIASQDAEQLDGALLSPARAAPQSPNAESSRRSPGRSPARQRPRPWSKGSGRASPRRGDTPTIRRAK
eukprot:TRINITY_DN2953_c2_g1_i1.p1 TRINITY_DN2953_c2_g1~~TRINITY_DN2953_c2_g1_i1.p1  ORF type:complete len:1040 (+),score=398.40 TRINITY_DN2953_c2_g1_i1:65-3184(+)